jgi:hypothetical protein
MFGKGILSQFVEDCCMIATLRLGKWPAGAMERKIYFGIFLPAPLSPGWPAGGPTLPAIDAK